LLEFDEFPASLSSSQVREAFGGGGAGAHIPVGVRQYIEERGLYR
jgi:nicotinic acid mononucleotide adenylyltransferase